MATPKERIRYTVEEYLAMERASDIRHEFLDGYVYAMAGESEGHGIITNNFNGLALWAFSLSRGLVAWLHFQASAMGVTVRNSRLRSGPCC